MIAAETLRVAAAGPGDVADGGSDDAVEGRGPPSEFNELINGVIRGTKALVGSLVGDADQAADIFVGERIEDNGIDDAVHSRAAADTEGERTERNRRKGALFRQAPRGESEILKAPVDPNGQ